MKYVADLGVNNTVVATYIQDDEFNVESPSFEITQQEYDSGTITQQKIDDAITVKTVDAKDVTKVQKIIKAAFLVCADYAGKSPAQFKTDVITKFDSL